MNFLEWLGTATKRNGKPLSGTTVQHYYNGFTVVSKEMLKYGVIEKRLEEMSLSELDVAVSKILLNPIFVKKDGTGNKMYSNALKRYRCYKFLNSDSWEQEKKEIEIIQRDKSIKETERIAIIKARVGQGFYREQLIEKYHEQCIMTHISAPQVLVASHIKPWAVSTNEERIDVNNGLLLSATYDRLFDSGLITFDSNGRLKVSTLVNQDNAEKLNISNGLVFDIQCNEKMASYLKYHNKVIFVGDGLNI